MKNLVGRQLGPYHLAAILGEGNMATVFRAQRADAAAAVALKVLPPQLAGDAVFVARFQQEARVIAALRHPNILPLLDFGESGGYMYMAMPLVERGTLAHYLRGEPLPLDEVRNCISSISQALDYAHRQGVVHRDVKPSNVLIDAQGHCLLTDFGVAKMLGSSVHLTATGLIVGTPTYMSPEQGLSQPVDRRSDIYALGILLYQMATGRVPFQAKAPAAVIMKHINDPLPSARALNPALPIEVERVIARSLAKRPDDRYATAADMLHALLDATAAKG